MLWPMFIDCMADVVANYVWYYVTSQMLYTGGQWCCCYHCWYGWCYCHVVMLLPLLEIVLADVIANVVADVIATFVLFGRCCANCCIIDTFVAEGNMVAVADVIATFWFKFGWCYCQVADVMTIIDLNLADVIAKWQME